MYKEVAVRLAVLQNSHASAAMQTLATKLMLLAKSRAVLMFRSVENKVCKFNASACWELDRRAGSSTPNAAGQHFAQDIEARHVPKNLCYR